MILQHNLTMFILVKKLFLLMFTFDKYVRFLV